MNCECCERRQAVTTLRVQCKTYVSHFELCAICADKATEVRTYRTEFPDFVLGVVIPAHWQDDSWHNDVCPSWLIPNVCKVYVDYLEPELRELPQARFSVYPDYETAEGEFEFHSDSWLDVLAYVQTREHIARMKGIVK